MGFFENLFKSKPNSLMYSNVDYSLFFTEKEYQEMKLELLELGEVYLPTGKIIACDPLVFLGDWKPFTKIVKPGSYPVTVCLADGDYAVVRIVFSAQTPVKWEMALTEDQSPKELKKTGDIFGYPVDAGLGCFCDEQAQSHYKDFDRSFFNANPDGNIYDDFFAGEFKKNAVNPNDPNDIGDWLNFCIPGYDNENILMFRSGFGDGYYPCYWGLDGNNEICQLIVDFLVFDFEDEEEEE